MSWFRTRARKGTVPVVSGATAAMVGFVAVILLSRACSDGTDGPRARPSAKPVGTADSGELLLSWPRESGRGDASALTLLLRPVDFVLDPFQTQERSQWLKWVTDRVPIELNLRLLVPSADGFTVAEFGPPCAPGNAPFHHCRAGGGQLTLANDSRDSRELAYASGQEPLPTNDTLPYSARPSLARAEFWTEQDPQTGIDRVVGWGCGRHGRTLPPLQFHPGIGVAPADSRLGCFTPPPVWRAWFSRVKREKHGVYLACRVRGHCNAYFSYHTRPAQLAYDYATVKFVPVANPNPGTEEEQAARSANAPPPLPDPVDPWMASSLLFTAWGTLERMRIDALRPESASDDWLEAEQQHQVCMAVIGEAQRWIEKQGFGLPEDAQEIWRKRQLELPCLKAASIAMRSGAARIDAAEKMLGSIQTGLASLDNSSAAVQLIFRARLRMIEQIGNDPRRLFEALRVSMKLFQGYSFVDERGEQHKRELQEQAVRIGMALDPPVPVEDLAPVVQQLLSYYSLSRDALAAVRVGEQWTRLLQARGASADEQLTALHELARSQWEIADFEGILSSCDRMRLVYLSRPAPVLAPVDLPRGAPMRYDPIGDAAFFAVLSYRNYVLHEAAAPGLVLPQMADIVARMEQDYGARNPYTQAARVHLREIETGQTLPDGTPLGAGYFGNWK